MRKSWDRSGHDGQAGQLIILLKLENLLVVRILNVNQNISAVGQLDYLGRDMDTANVVPPRPLGHLDTEPGVRGKPELVLRHHFHLAGGAPRQGQALQDDAGRHCDPLSSPSSPGP